MIRTSLLCIKLLILSAAAQAQSPSLLPIQGHIVDGNGQAIEGDLSVQFSLYASPMGGSPLYQESQPVDFRGGHFFAYVGDGGNLNLDVFRENNGMYLGIKVAEDAEMRPRILLATTAYAAFADQAGNAEKLGGKAAEDYALKTDTTTLTWNNLQGVPAGFADGVDDDTRYNASTGLSLNGTTFSVDQNSIETWARNACYDTEAELRAVLDQYYSNTGSGNIPWTSISSLPPSLADGVDNDTTYVAGNGLDLNGNAFSLNQATVESMIQNSAYNVGELRSVLDSVYLNQTSTSSGQTSNLAQIQNLNCSPGDVIYVGPSGNLECQTASVITSIPPGSTAGSHHLTDRVQWTRAYNTYFGYSDEPPDIATHSNGNIYITGSFRDIAPNLGSGAPATNLGAGGSATGCMLAGYNSAGAHRWSFIFRANNNDICYANSIAIDNNENIYIGGFFRGAIDFGGGLLTSAGGWDGFVASFSGANGSFRWAQRLGQGSQDYVQGVNVTSSGIVYVTGYYDAALGGGPDLLVSSYDAAHGGLRWQNLYGDAQGQYGYDVSSDSADNVYVTGYMEGSLQFGPSAPLLTAASNWRDMVVASLDSAGNHRWSHRFGGAGVDGGRSIAVDSSANVFVTGEFHGTIDFGGGLIGAASPNSPEIFVTSFDSTGNYRWAKRLGGTDNDIGETITTDDAGNIYLAGHFQGRADFARPSPNQMSTANGNEDAFVASYNNNGEFRWLQTFGGNTRERDTPKGLSWNNGYLNLIGTYSPAGDGLDYGGRWLLPGSNGDSLFLMAITP